MVQKEISKNREARPTKIDDHAFHKMKREREKERDLVNFETEFHARLRGGLLVTVHLLLTLTLLALA